MTYHQYDLRLYSFGAAISHETSKEPKEGFHPTQRRALEALRDDVKNRAVEAATNLSTCTDLLDLISQQFKVLDAEGEE